MEAAEARERTERRLDSDKARRIVAAGAALALSEGLRKKVLDALFGAEEEFEYSSTTTSSSSAPQPAGAAT